MIFITAGKLVLRPIEQSDAPRFAELCNDDMIARNTARIPIPYCLTDAERFVAYAVDAFTSRKEFPFAVCRNDKIIACAGVMPNGDKSCELGYWVGAQDRQMGVAGKAAAAVAQFAFERLGAEILTAGHFTDNPASGRVLEKLGFRPTGDIIKTMSVGRGVEVETVRFELRREDFTSDPGIRIES